MQQGTKRLFAILGAGVAILASACTESSPMVSTAGGDLGLALNFEKNAAAFDISAGFTPLTTSAVCRVGGGLSQFALPAGFTSTLVASEPDFADLGDMHTVNENGSNPGRYLYRTHEIAPNAGVSVTDLATGATRMLSVRADWERFDGIAWTPWGTILAAEEVNPGAGNVLDPDFPAATAGLLYEIDPITGDARARPAVGAKSHEGIRFDAQQNLYGISERAPGFIFKFVADRRGDLREGQLYALRIVEDAGDRTGWAEWAALDRAQVKINADAAAEAVGATGYSRPEDVETSASTGDDRQPGQVLYVALTGEDRVLAIDLSEKQGRVYVSDYVRDGVNAPADFDMPDNLALDQDGNLFITEDPGGSAPSKTRGDDVWVTRRNPGSARVGMAAERFLSITDCNAEPTGIYFSKSGKSLFVNVQHRGADGRDGAFAIQRVGQISFAPSAQD